VVVFEVDLESAGEPVVSSGLHAAVEDHRVGGVRHQDPDLPAERGGSRISWNQLLDQASGAIASLVTSSTTWRERDA
jgi:hypothetical protein